MSYTIETSTYFKKVGLWTETKTYSVMGNTQFDLESIEEILNQWSYDGEIKDGEIIHENGNKTKFAIYYNGKFCKKYANGINKV